MSAKSLPKTTSIRALLVAVTIFYATLGGISIGYARQGGKSWNGDTNTLTSILAVIGAVFAITSRILLSQCKAAGLQWLASQAMRGSVSLDCLHKMDIALRGSMRTALNSPWSISYRLILPVLAIVTSATFKKTLGTGLESSSVIITGNDASFVDPTSVGNGIRGTSFAGAILYNTTTSIGNGMNPAQRSWTYIAADASSAGYAAYYATSAPALASRVQCSANQYQITQEFGGILNADYAITLGYVNSSTAIIQITTAANTTWSCPLHLGTTNGTAKYISDMSGNWNISSVNMSAATSLAFVTTPARGNMMADIISDALATTRGYSGWNWSSSTSNSTGYALMLISTRLSFAAATMAFSEKRAGASPNGVSGEADQPVEKILLHDNWALIVTSVLLLLQALLAFVHIWPFGYRRIDFGILQIMEMRASAVTLQAPGNDAGVALSGHCSQQRTDITAAGRVAIRSRGGHLGFVRDNVGQGWAMVNSTSYS